MQPVKPIEPAADPYAPPQVDPAPNPLRDNLNGFLDSNQGKAFVDLVESQIDIWMEIMAEKGNPDRDFLAGGVKFGKELLVAIDFGHTYGRYVSWKANQNHTSEFKSPRQRSSGNQQASRRTAAQSI